MDPIPLRLLLVAGLLVVVLAAGWLVQRRDGTVRHGGDARLRGDHLAAVGLDLSDGAAGAVLLGSPTCTPCDSVKRVLGDIEVERAGFRWVYADAADHLALADEHKVMRVPTLFMVAADGRIMARSSGVPRHDDLRRVLDAGGDLDTAA
jgi:thiol-disulfide isomerase/thioredoxin